MNVEYIVSADLVLTVLGLWYLLNDNKRLRTSLKDQANNLSFLKELADVFKKYIDPAEIDKLIKIKIDLNNQETEVIRRNVIKSTSAEMQKQWHDRFENELKPTIDSVHKEFTDFVMIYFINVRFKTKKERNDHIMNFFPKNGTALIKYLDEYYHKDDSQNDTPLQNNTPQ